MATQTAFPRPVRALPHRRYGARHGWVAAHRGGMGLAPENTLAAFTRAVELGVDYLETDVRATADGVAIAFHDRALDRVTDLRGPVASRTWAELSRARVHGTEPVLLLEDLLGSFPEACVTVDVKEGRAVRPLVEAIRRTRSAGRVCVAGGWDGWLDAVREGCGPAVTTALGWRALATLLAAARSGARAPRGVVTGAFAHLPLAYGRLAVLRDARVAERLLTMTAELGLGVVAWTIDDPATAHRLLDDGVAGVITDRPDLLAGLGRPPTRTAAPTR